MDQTLPSSGPEPLEYFQPGMEPSGVPAFVGALSVAFGILIILKSALIGSSTAQESFSFNNQTYAPVMTFQPPAAPLNRRQAAAICSYVNSRPAPAPRLNPSQISDLTAALLSPKQLLFYPAPSAEMPQQITSIREYAVPDIDVSTARGTIQLSYSGGWRITHLNAQSYKLISNTTNIKPVEFTVTFLEIVWLAFGVLLLLAGVSALRKSPRAVFLHRLYAGIKIPTILLGAMIEVVIFASDRSDLAIPAIVPLLVAAPSLVYPFVLLVVLDHQSDGSAPAHTRMPT